MKYADLVAADRRLSILLVLAESDGYRCNAFLLQSLLAAYGHDVSLALLATELAWLAELGLVGVEELAGVSVAGLSKRGADVAAGRAAVPGVKRPAPR